MGCAFFMYNNLILIIMPNTVDTMHLFITNKCDHVCPLCCNNLYDIEKIPVATVEELKQVSTVCITGGEPFDVLSTNLSLISGLRIQFPNIQNLYIYTSGPALVKYRGLCLDFVSGVNITPKNKHDWKELEHMPNFIVSHLKQMKENRLYVFKDQMDNFEEYKSLVEKLNLQVIYRRWDKEFKTPDNEIFRRLPILL